MAKISESKGRPDENSGYVRVVGSVALGKLLSRVQATVIRNGNELENLLKSNSPYFVANKELNTLSSDPIASEVARVADVLDDRVEATAQPVQVFFKYKLERPNEKAIVSDVIVVDNKSRTVYAIELKDGDTFDTKKASGELASLEVLSSTLAERLGYTAKLKFCAFNQSDKNAIVVGAKGRFTADNAMTGAELCQLIGVDYDQVRKSRKEDEMEKFSFLLREMLDIFQVRAEILSLLEETKE